MTVLTDPKSIRIDSIYITRTYGGVLEGLPTTDETLDHARRRAKELWGQRATLLVPPKTTTTQLSTTRSAERCPEWMILAWLDAPAMDDANDGSELVVIWFQDSPTFEIPAALLHDLGCGTWERHASDWQM